jgi:Ig-like domain from next to BRCA1 gene
MRRFRSILAGTAIIAAMLACNLPSGQQDPAAVMTAAALTVQAVLSPTVPSSAATATFTPAAFPTVPPPTATVPTLPPAASSTPNCDNASFVTDVTYPDGTVVSAGDSFTKTWRFRNIGNCSWTPSYALVYVSGESMGGPSAQALTGNINPGQTVDLSVALTAPAANGTHVGNWGLRNAAGVIFAHFYVQVQVEDGSGGAFAVIHVTYALSTWSDGGHTDCPRVTAQITTNGPGSVGYHWTRSDGSSGTSATLTFASAGTQSIHYDWALGSVWAGTTSWVGIYIEEPNHQDFNHKTFTTACTSP